MRKNRFTFFAFTFIAGTFFGISMLAVVSFVNPAPPANTPISPDVARTLVRAYKNSGTGITYAFKLDENMFDAIKAINGQSPDTKEFRIYMGIENKTDTVGVVVALNKQGRDDTTKVILKTSSQHSGMCPPVCDSQSPIR